MKSISIGFVQDDGSKEVGGGEEEFVDFVVWRA